MKKLSMLAVGAILVAMFATGCSTTHSKSTTPLSEPVTVSGPVNVTGPVTVSGPVSVTSGQSSSLSGGAAQPALQSARSTATGAAVGATVGATAVNGEGTVLELKKETATAQKTTVSNGKAVIRKNVITEQVSVPVQTRREEFTVEEIADDAAPTTSWGEAQTVFELPLTRESASIVITPRVYKRVKINKTATVDQGAVTGSVRTENVEVVKQPAP